MIMKTDGTEDGNSGIYNTSSLPDTQCGSSMFDMQMSQGSRVWQDFTNAIKYEFQGFPLSTGENSCSEESGKHPRAIEATVFYIGTILERQDRPRQGGMEISGFGYPESSIRWSSGFPRNCHLRTVFSPQTHPDAASSWLYRSHSYPIIITCCDCIKAKKKWQ